MKESKKQSKWAAIQAAAELLVELLEQLGFVCALCGDLACWSYGQFRLPNKVEVVVFIPRDSFLSVDALKQTIAWKSSGHFHIIPFSFSHPQRSSSSSSSSVALCYCYQLSTGSKNKRVNIELICCHDAKPDQVWYLNGLPLAPLSFLVLRKLEKWEETTNLKRRQIVNEHMRHLLDMLEMYRPDDVPFSSQLHELSRRRIQVFCSAFPEYANAWRRLGFEPLLVDTSRAAAAAAITSTPLPKVSALPHQDTKQFMIENPNRIQMVFLAGLTTVAMLHKLGFSCAVYGSLACFLYGNLREPNDVDLLVLPPHNSISVEDLKLAVERLDPVHFYLVPSKRPGAAYKMLCYRLSNTSNVQTVSTSCKVDLVFPGTLHLPALPRMQIFWDEGLPLIPFSLLLLRKLQGWDDHRISGEEIKRLKQGTDAADVEGLLELTGTVSLRFSRPWSDRLLFSEEFEAMSRRRVRLYCSVFPECAESWRLLGLD